MERMARVSEEAVEQTEGPVARAIEMETSRIPSDVWLWMAGASMLASLGLQFFGGKKTRDHSLFVGQWVPTLLILGLYNKIVKVAGSDRLSR